MSGMHTQCSYTNFSTNDADKFERWLKKWCRKFCNHGSSMIAFDENELLLRNRATVEMCDGREFFQVTLKDIAFAYICVHGSMCILYKVWENKTQSVLYDMPTKWNNSEIWLPADV